MQDRTTIPNRSSGKLQEKTRFFLVITITLSASIGSMSVVLSRPPGKIWRAWVLWGDDCATVYMRLLTQE
jgi:hypothetical protein